MTASRCLKFDGQKKSGPEITGISGPGEFSLSGESYVSTLFIGPRDLSKEVLLKEHQK
jgi:hypothetical protein